MKQSLYALTCFSHVDTIAPIVAGLSSQCYQVEADNKTFFAKLITSTNEINICLHAASQNLGPIVIYHDRYWLINEYIAGENLALSSQSIDKKIIIALELMVKCHQMAIKPLALDPKSIIFSGSIFLNESSASAMYSSNTIASILLLCIFPDELYRIAQWVFHDRLPYFLRAGHG